MSSTELPRHIVDRFDVVGRKDSNGRRARLEKRQERVSLAYQFKASPSFDGCSARGRHKNQLKWLRLLLQMRGINSSCKLSILTLSMIYALAA
jgi:hypothetical protein